MAAEAAAGATVTALVEKTMPALARYVGSLPGKASAWRRCREYRTYQSWTRSPLQISTALDWGHTCSIAIAIDEGAKQYFSTGSTQITRPRSPNSWGFTSRTLVERALDLKFTPERWSLFVEYAIAQWPARSTEKAWPSFQFQDPSVCDYIFDKIFKEASRAWGINNPSLVPEDVRAFCKGWLLKTNKDLSEKIVYAVEGEMQYSMTHLCGNEMDGSDRAREEVSVTPELCRAVLDGFFVIQLVTNLHSLCFLETDLISTCSKKHTTVRARALEVSPCPGAFFRLTDANRKRGSPSDLVTSFTKRLKELQNAWEPFLSDWKHVVSAASTAFPFRVVPNLHDLVLHDMVTGFCAPSAMRRVGAKYVDEEGSTIVHAGERAAVVSRDVVSLQLNDCVLSRLGVSRKMRSSAQEFADYALLRCDLVCRERMTFEKALEDWNRLYARWDRSPESLSKWKIATAENWDDEHQFVDSIRLVLIRQALGPLRSLNIVRHALRTCSLFGGLVPGDDESVADHEPRFLIDDMLKIMFTAHRAKNNVKFLVDTVGSTGNDRGAQGDAGVEGLGAFHKLVEASDMPDVFHVSEAVNPQCSNRNKQECWWFD